jgi:putative ATPase
MQVGRSQLQPLLQLMQRAFFYLWAMIQQAPLAERMRPTSLDEFIGQEHLVGVDGTLRKVLHAGTAPSMIFWGPPGVGKTTLAQLIAGITGQPFHGLSAINSGVKDVRDTIAMAEKRDIFSKGRPILFIDEIHRFSKAQQDSLLGAVERGTVSLIGATTENPSFEVISALLSRTQVYVMQPLSRVHLEHLLQSATVRDKWLAQRKIELQQTEALMVLSGGDARRLLNTFELVVQQFDPNEKVVITDQFVKDCIQQRMVLYDKAGEQHYDVISAFIKSMRGSDPNAALYYLARMIEAGEDPKFIARRMLILAAEDIGLANPNALLMANACFDAVAKIGYPECDLILAECVIYLATSPKSNSSYKAIRAAQTAVREDGHHPVPLHLRNAPTQLMKELKYGEGYGYAHDHPGHFIAMEFLPEEIKGQSFYQPATNPREAELLKFLKERWKGKYGYE